ncbi:helix-turn-helix domain-containing protein [Kitasatospora sp. NPDC088264]|uniref:helix-turn-helix domain-containing protein n=1 Tax=Kitasatospora sp. NPDC088264 TaxID=3155296 RepID=UPI0034405E0B
MTESGVKRVQSRDTAQGMSEAELLALPTAVSVQVAARALNIGVNKAYELIKAGEFPVRLLTLGQTIKVPTAELRTYLGVEMNATVVRETAS